ncbi:TonB-dependent siderophore receptor [Aliarcobacter vitoriensis]|uniref:TonB-dependent siderophore receptor n=1 Tax=Aliarcobacter vitoriensis TaxID=2011099 RepID=UPI003AAEA667
MNLSLKETPQSVSVITSKRMEDQQLNNLVDVMKNTTGVNVNEGIGSAGFAYFFSRGYEIQNLQVDGSPSNYIRNNYGFREIDSSLYDSISIVRGATGLLTGAGEPSGSINLVRKKPTKEFQASLEAQAGRWDKYRGVVDIAGGFNEDGSIRGRFIAVHNQGGYFNPIFDRENSTLYGVVEADLGDSTTITGSYERTNHESNFQAYAMNPDIFSYNTSGKVVGLTNFDKYMWDNSDWTKDKETRDNYTLNIEHHINNSWKINTNYSYTNGDQKLKYSNCSRWLDDGTCSSSYYATNVEYDREIHTLDVKLNGQFDLFNQTHDLVMGFNGKKHKEDAISLDRPNVNSQTDMKIINNRLVHIEPIWNGIKSTGNTETQQYGGFVSTKLNFTDDLSAILGGRYSKYEAKSKGIITRDTDNFLPYLALTYDLTDNLTTYVSYTEIFNPQSAKDKNDNLLDPETGFNYEVGLKGEWFDGRLNSSIALFQSGKDNLAVQDKDENGICYKRPGTNNCAFKAENDTKNKGWEFEVSGEITPYWQAQFGFSSSILKDKDGKRLNSTILPIRTANLFTTYRATPSLTVGGGVRWQSETWDNNAKNNYISAGHPEMVGEATQKDYFVVDLMANYEFNKNLSLLVNLNNALNKEYKTNFYYHSYGDERNWMATLKYKF